MVVPQGLRQYLYSMVGDPARVEDQLPDSLVEALDGIDNHA